MNVLVSDTSVLIDLERGSLLDTSFALTFRFAVPDLLYRQELASHPHPDQETRHDHEGQGSTAQALGEAEAGIEEVDKRCRWRRSRGETGGQTLLRTGTIPVLRRVCR